MNLEAWARNAALSKGVFEMSRSTNRTIRAGLVMAVSLVVMVALALPPSVSARPIHSTISTEASPGPRASMGMAYDAARHQVVMFGGIGDSFGLPGGTWTWDGHAWTQQHPAHSPPPRADTAMAYDAARGQSVLFGGDGHGGYFGDTWTWDGTDWSQQSPAHSPSPRFGMRMVYDAARHEVVLFGGFAYGDTDFFNDTWTWDGTDWTQLSPAHSPSSRLSMGMAFDAARHEVVLFGGRSIAGDVADTWIWDGTNWTQLSPAHSPSPRDEAGMAYETGRDRVVLFGGYRTGGALNDTWIWDGMDWALLSPAHSPSPRDEVGMAYDAVSTQVVLFGGYSGSLGDTWTWDGTDWTQHPRGWLRLAPRSGAAGTRVLVLGYGFAVQDRVRLTFVDSMLGGTPLGRVRADADGGFHIYVSIPLGATGGRQHVKATGVSTPGVTRRSFTVT